MKRAPFSPLATAVKPGQPEPLGAHPDLRRRLLAGNVDGVRAAAREGRQRLQEQRRATFWDDTLAPVLAEARALGIGPDQIVTYIQEQQ